MPTSDRTVLITGGGSGLGAACAEHFVAAGARVVVADINGDAAALAAQPLGDKAVAAPCDVCSEASVQAAIDLALERFGALQGVIHCAGILAAARVVGKHGPHDLALFRRVVEVNLVGSFNVARLAAATMQRQSPNEQGERGVIVLTSSIAAFEGQIGQAAYAAAKGGVAALTLPLARELGDLGIRVVSIAPGVFNTPMMAAAPPRVRESLEQQIPFPRRLGHSVEFARLAWHICENVMLNGVTLRLDGGLRMAPQ
jgi:NAD(P)-dependent dehydrogenase (short-subunit alcohol dehydrogenase family)